MNIGAEFGSRAYFKRMSFGYLSPYSVPKELLGHHIVARINSVHLNEALGLSKSHIITKDSDYCSHTSCENIELLYHQALILRPCHVEAIWRK